MKITVRFLLDDWHFAFPLKWFTWPEAGPGRLKNLSFGPLHITIFKTK